MKRPFSLRGITAALALVAVSATSPLFAQTDYANRLGSSHLTIGPGFGLGASMILSPFTGQKVAPLFSYHLGLDASYPLTSTIASNLSLGIESRGTQVYPDGNSDAYTNTRVSYFHITPGFTFSAFYLGLNIAMPTGGSNQTKDNTTDMTTDQEDHLLTLIEPRIGAVIPVMDSPIGWLGITVTGGVSLDEFFDRGGKPSGVDSDDWGNYQNASLYVGSTFQFAIPGTGK